MTHKRSVKGNRINAETAIVAGVCITHPEKIWWPEEGITKLDAARYYAGIASHILPWLKNHPLTAERCPDGIEGECFFQKDFSHALPAGVPTCRIPTENTGKIVHYVIGGSKETLLDLVNLGCIAVRVMNCRVHSLDRPDWLAFDLDPSSGNFSDAAKAATVLREILKELQIVSYPNTSGRRGLHILVPLRSSRRTSASLGIRHVNTTRPGRAEARAASALNHPSICTIHDIDEVENQHFII